MGSSRAWLRQGFTSQNFFTQEGSLSQTEPSGNVIWETSTPSWIKFDTFTRKITRTTQEGFLSSVALWRVISETAANSYLLQINDWIATGVDTDGLLSGSDQMAGESLVQDPSRTLVTWHRTDLQAHLHNLNIKSRRGIFPTRGWKKGDRQRAYWLCHCFFFNFFNGIHSFVRK